MEDQNTGAAMTDDVTPVEEVEEEGAVATPAVEEAEEGANDDQGQA